MAFMCMTLEVSKLSGWLNPCAPCRESKGGHTVRGEGASREAAGGRLASAEHAACRGLRARLQSWGRARGGAHVEHVAYLSDFGGVEAQRLVEHRRALPRVERRGIRCVARGAAREAGGRRATPANAACRGGLDCRLGAGLGEERTLNILYMFVTLEVSKLSGWLNADAP